MVEDGFAELFDRERLLEGLPARRAATLLFLIESTTARLVARSRRAMQRYGGGAAAEERELAFLEAFALGREPPVRPTIQDLERHAEAWAPLVARNPRVRAALAGRLAERHRFAHRDVPGIRAALGLDDPAVAAAFEQLHGAPMQSVYVRRRTPRARLRWAQARFAARVDRLSPFWTAYSLTLTETVGSTIVALPIAVAAIGPLPAVAVLVGLGLLNVLTVAFMADALARTRTMRYGDAYIGRVVTRLLGRPGALVLSAGVVGICLLGMQADYIGVSATLDDATGVPDIAWVAALFAIELLYLKRGSIDATVTSALVVGVVNLLLILALCGLAFTHVDTDRLTALPHIDRGALELVFGVTFTAFFGHLSVSNCARVVLTREPTGKALLRGVTAAQVTAILLYVLFVVAVAGAVDADTLAAAEGTALGPLADNAGTAVLALGGVLVVLGMGMASIHSGLALFYLVRERLPSVTSRTLLLPRGSARLLLGDRAELTYRGLQHGQPLLRLEQDGQRTEQRVGRDWVPQDVAVRVAVRDADAEQVRLEVTTPLRLRVEGQWEATGLSLGGLLALDGAEAEVLAWLLRRAGATAADVATEREIPAEQALTMLDELTAAGLVVRHGDRYVARAGRRRGGRLSQEVWAKLAPEDAAAAAPVQHAATPWVGRSERVRWLAGVSPVVFVFLAALAQAATGAVSLADVLSVLGVVIVALLAGVFPVLLIVAARRRGEIAAPRRRALAHPLVLGSAYVASVSGVAAHGLYLWEDTGPRIAALAVTVLCLVLTWSMVRRGTFRPLTTVELRHDLHAGTATVHAVTAGTEVTPAVRLVAEPVPTATVTFAAPPGQTRIWAHSVVDDAESAPLPGQADGVPLDAEGEALLPAPGREITIRLTR